MRERFKIQMTCGCTYEIGRLAAHFLAADQALLLLLPQIEVERPHTHEVNRRHGVKRAPPHRWLTPPRAALVLVHHIAQTAVFCSPACLSWIACHARLADELMGHTHPGPIGRKLCKA